MQAHLVKPQRTQDAYKRSLFGVQNSCTCAACSGCQKPRRQDARPQENQAHYAQHASSWYTCRTPANAAPQRGSHGQVRDVTRTAQRHGFRAEHHFLRKRRQLPELRKQHLGVRRRKRKGLRPPVQRAPGALPSVQRVVSRARAHARLLTGWQRAIDKRNVVDEAASKQRVCFIEDLQSASHLVRTRRRVFNAPEAARGLFAATRLESALEGALGCPPPRGTRRRGGAQCQRAREGHPRRRRTAAPHASVSASAARAV